ncbi:hypothetical protein V8F33_011935 [Rhypophila sp. PSN 637]
MQFLRFVVALFLISIHGAITAGMNSQGCPQDPCYEGPCKEGRLGVEGCSGNAKCRDFGTPGQLGCCAPCRTIQTVPLDGVPSWITSIVSTHPVPTLPKSIKSIPIPSDRSTSASATHTHHGCPPGRSIPGCAGTSTSNHAPGHTLTPTYTFLTTINITNVPSTITNGPSFLKSIESLITDRSTSVDATHTHHGCPPSKSFPGCGGKEPTPTFFTSSIITNVPSIVTAGPSSFIKSIQSLLTDKSISTPAPAHTYTYTTEAHGYGGGGGPGTPTGTDMPSPIQIHTTEVVGGGGGDGAPWSGLSTLISAELSKLTSALAPSGTHTTHHGCPLGGSFPHCAGTSTSKDASPAVTDIPTHFTTTFTPTHQGTSTPKDASLADPHTVITNEARGWPFSVSHSHSSSTGAHATPTLHDPHHGCPPGSDCVPE